MNNIKALGLLRIALVIILQSMRKQPSHNRLAYIGLAITIMILWLGFDYILYRKG